MCREMGLDRRTVVSRLDRGATIEAALDQRTRSYPKSRKSSKAVPAEPEKSRFQQERPTQLFADAVDLMVDVKEILAGLEPTPKIARVLSGVRQWLRHAGWW